MFAVKIEAAQVPIETFADAMVSGILSVLVGQLGQWLKEPVESSGTRNVVLQKGDAII